MKSLKGQALKQVSAGSFVNVVSSSITSPIMAVVQLVYEITKTKPKKNEIRYM